MAEGYGATLANAILDAIGNATAYSVTTLYVKLHTGAPGAAGTSNAATETTRKAVSCGAASGGAMSNDADIVWSGISGSQDATHLSFWDHLSAGNFLCSGTMTANAYTAGDTLTIPAGDLDFTITLAS